MLFQRNFYNQIIRNTNLNMRRILLFILLFFIGFNHAQVKQNKKLTSKKEWVNPVKLTKEEKARPYMSEVLKTRDSLTPVEAERRRKNIEAGNPFKKYGYYPKVATLSKGKYLEFHDQDSIVTIGSVTFNVKKGEIVDFIEVNLDDPDAQPIGDTHGRWISPDPLSEEFPSWSPYSMSFNNPVRFKDPTGLAPEDATECCWWLRLMPLFEESSIKPNLIETVTKTGEVGTKQSEAVTKAQQEHFNFGRYVEEKQLAEMGKEKNTKTYEYTDPKTGKTGKTIPDAMTDEGGTVEIKHVAKQSFTKQLRGQQEISKASGQEAILKINESAKLSEPLKNSGINIQRYTPPAKPKIDNLRVIPAPAPKLIPVPKPKDPCAGVPGCT
ncbi:putative toxin [Sphingobacterium sp. UGAL515B_05]|uniref:putative toxin n=1 Tax=Sphingobacterium sp. UGAL515B_05 TaxID=2986767 RepID=UPI00295385CB|nr:putative toxin [Sphingobacterium sp. UGAL515B_05]WON94364.1 putative toxin [Sphingobacterium sp. UGAL515B_05]